MIFGSVGSVLRSVRSIWRPRVVVDRPGYKLDAWSEGKLLLKKVSAWLELLLVQLRGRQASENKIF